jgi:phage host-nuclease inhibitor protein Gam
MAQSKKRVRSDSLLIPIPDWGHADEYVRRMGSLQGQIRLLEDEATEQVARIKSHLKTSTAARQEKILLYQASLEAFAKSRREEFGKVRSRKLNHGIVGWRKSTVMRLKKNTLDLIREFFTPARQKPLITIKESPDKNAIAKLTDEDLAVIEARREEKDVFFVEPDVVEAAEL